MFVSKVSGYIFKRIFIKFIKKFFLIEILFKQHQKFLNKTHKLNIIYVNYVFFPVLFFSKSPKLLKFKNKIFSKIKKSPYVLYFVLQETFFLFLKNRRSKTK